MDRRLAAMTGAAPINSPFMIPENRGTSRVLLHAFFADRRPPALDPGYRSLGDCGRPAKKVSLQ